MSLAADTRRAVEAHPFLLAALRAGVVNYTAAARFLDLEGDVDAVATALRRFADELHEYEPAARDVRVRMESGFGRIDDPGRAEAMLSIGTAAFGSVGGDLTAIVATGEVDAASHAAALEHLAIADVEPVASAAADGALFVVVERRDGANALRAVERALESVPSA